MSAVTTPAPATHRWAGAGPFAVLGAACVVAGGLVSAVTAPHASEHGSWAAAYLVLVGGVAQLAFGLGQARLAARPVGTRLVVGEFAAWNAGNAAVLAGTLLAAGWAVDVGGLLLVVALVLFLVGTRGTGGSRTLRYGYRALVGLLAVSVPVGLALAVLRG